MPHADFPRLIEFAFPLKQASLDSVHEKNVRHGHISTLHIWPARRPLAACRAALIATLLPDPSAQPKPEGMSDAEWQKEIRHRRQELCEKIGGRVVKKIERKRLPGGRVVERIKEETKGGILHWGRETENAELLDWFRRQIRNAYGGLPAPRPGKFFVYVIKCNDDSFYIGQTDNVERRFEQHQQGRVQWTATRKPLQIIHWEEFDSREEAVKREKELKTGFGRQWLKREYAAGRTRQAGRAPKVLDPFAGGGSIPLEAMRLGCQATAIDINPVAWFILKCTLEYPQKLAGKTRPLPDFILKDREFMMDFLVKGRGYTKSQAKKILEKYGHKSDEEGRGWLFDPQDDDEIQADLAWHVRAWGRWVLDRARRELAPYYPTYADFEPLDKNNGKTYEPRPMQLVPLKEDGTPDIDALNAEFSEEYLADKRNPRWVAKPTVAYLWARTVTCKNCRATIPLLKTRWLCKKANKRVLLTLATEDTEDTEISMPRNNSSVNSVPSVAPKKVVFGIQTNVPVKGGNAAQRREHDKRIGAGTMSRAGAKCPCCGTIMTMEDLRVEGKAGRLGTMPTAVVVDGTRGKEYRPPTEHEIQMAAEAAKHIDEVFAQIPFGAPDEPTPAGGGRGAGRAFSIQNYGLMRWRDLFTPRQLLALAAICRATRCARSCIVDSRYDVTWSEVLSGYLGCGLDRLVDFCNVNTQWKVDADTINHALVRFAIQITWDFAEANPLGDSAGAYILCLNRIATALDTLVQLPQPLSQPSVICCSAKSKLPRADIIVTDPPYYDAIPYSDLMDWFYVWLRRTVCDFGPSYSAAMESPLGPKWDSEQTDGEFIDDETRHGGDAHLSKSAYEDGMADCFRRCVETLSDSGRLVIVFANKQPDAWETLVSSVIKSGFIAQGSWPIQTEQPSRTRGLASAALASSVWLVCKKRPHAARPGWDNKVLEEMRERITERLRDFWDAGIRGPDFVWAATGPALEAYSKHPIVKKADRPGEILTVSEFLRHVRRMVVDFVVGRVLTGDGEAIAASDRLDEPTTYYLLHRHDFGMDEAPVGACILYATACGLSDQELIQTWDLLGKTAGATEGTEDAEDNDLSVDSVSSGADNSGSKVKLKSWAQRRGRSMGYEAPGGRPVPLIDRVHRLMHLWKAGDVQKVDEYLDDHGLRRHELFGRVLQSLIELSNAGSDERSLLESLSNHLGMKGAVRDRGRMLPFEEADEL